jgi:uncharacterized protein (TIGR03643 family)
MITDPILAVAEGNKLENTARSFGRRTSPQKKVLVLKQKNKLTEAQVSEIVHMALSDHVAFSDIELQYGLKEREVVTLMRQTLKTGSYRNWRKRVATFGSRREHYKQASTKRISPQC